MTRLFFAIWPPLATADALHRWSLQVQRAAGGRATSAAAIHLTLAFLGGVAPGRGAAAREAAHSVQGGRHDLLLDEARRWAQNRIVWVGPHETPVALEALAQTLVAALTQAGFVPEQRRFAAHVTLLRKVAAPCHLPPLPRVAWPVEEFSLVESKLDAAGSRYEIVERFPLTA